MSRCCVSSGGVPAFLLPEIGLKHSAIFLSWLKVQTFAECQSASIDWYSLISLKSDGSMDIMKLWYVLQSAYQVKSCRQFLLHKGMHCSWCATEWAQEHLHIYYSVCTRIDGHTEVKLKCIKKPAWRIFPMRKKKLQVRHDVFDVRSAWGFEQCMYTRSPLRSLHDSCISMNSFHVIITSSECDSIPTHEMQNISGISTWALGMMGCHAWRAGTMVHGIMSWLLPRDRGAVLHGIANTFTVACAPVIFVWFTLVPEWLS